MVVIPVRSHFVVVIGYNKAPLRGLFSIIGFMRHWHVLHELLQPVTRQTGWGSSPQVSVALFV